MNLLARWFLINFVRKRMAARSARRHTTSFGRPRRRTQVRVGGCCLPIPLGVVALGALATRLHGR